MLPDSLSPEIPRSRATLLGQLGRLLDAGLPPSQAGPLLLQQPVGGAATPLAQAIASALTEGRPLGAALRGQRGVPAYYPALLDAGQESGTLDSVLAQLVEDSDREAERRKKLISWLAYPALLFLAAGILLPLPSLVDGSLGSALTTALPLLAVPVGGLLLLASAAAAVQRGDDWPRRIPGVARLVDLAARSRWCRVVARLLGAGLALPAILGHAAEAAGAGPIGDAARGVERDSGRGAVLGESIARRELLTPATLPLAAEAQLVGTGDTAFLRAAVLLEDELDELVRSRTRRLGAAAYAAAALMVLYKVGSFWAAAFGSLG